MRIIISERQLTRLVREVDTKGTYFGSERSWKKELYKGFKNQEKEKIGSKSDINISFEFIREVDGRKSYKVIFSGSDYEEILNSFSDEERKEINNYSSIIVVDNEVRKMGSVGIKGLNQIHFQNGIHPLLRGRDLGNKVYKEFIKMIGYTIGYGATKELRNQFRKLAEDSEFESLICSSSSDGWVLIFDKNWSGNKNEISKIFKEKICNPDWEFRSDIVIED